MNFGHNDDISNLPLHPLTDLGNAERLVHHYGNSLFTSGGQWYRFTGAIWQRIDEEVVVALATETVRRISKEASLHERPQEVYMWAEESESRSRLLAMVDLAGALLNRSSAALDSDPYKLNVRNGIVDLKTAQLLPHSRDELHTKLAPVVYNPEATCPRWDEFMQRITGGDDGMIRFLHQCLGYSLTGTHGEYLFVPYGLGANGKSVFLRTAQEVLGNYAQQAVPQMLVAGKVYHPTVLARLKGARLFVAQETGRGQVLDETLVKMLTGGDRLAGYFMRQDVIEFAPTHTTWMATNHKPEIRGMEEAIWRRIVLIPFDVTIPESERDPHLTDKLIEEGSGILNRMLQGLADYRHNGLVIPDRVRTASEAYRNEMDTVGAFARKHIRAVEGNVIRGSEVYVAYLHYCDFSDTRPLDLKSFNRRLLALGYQKHKRKEGICWIDTALVDEAGMRIAA